MKNIRKAIALVLAVAALFCLPIQASADEASATIDYTRTGSLSIYKYDLTRAESDGAWDTNAYVSTGIYDQSVVDRMTDYTVYCCLGRGQAQYIFVIRRSAQYFADRCRSKDNDYKPQAEPA